MSYGLDIDYINNQLTIPQFTELRRVAEFESDQLKDASKGSSSSSFGKLEKTPITADGFEKILSKVRL